MESQTTIIIVMVVYIILLISWGIYQGRKVRTGKDFAIAGRTLPGWAAALSERATGESSWALLGLPGAAYAMGLTEIWTAVGCVAGIITAWSVLAWRLRDEAEKYNVSTFTELLAAKHGECGRMLRIIASLVIVFFFFFYVGAQFLGGGKTLHTLFGMDPWTGVIITAALIIPYTVYGGFRSVVYTDVIQAVLMIFTLIVGPIVGVFYILDHQDLYASSITEALVKAGPGYISLTATTEGFAAGLILAGGFSWFFGYLGGQPQLSVRFMAIKNSPQAKKARNIGIIWTIFAYIGAMMIGWIGLAIFGPTGLSDPEYVMPNVLLTLFHPLLAGLLITGAIAAMISTADSLLVLSATELTESFLNSNNKNNKGISSEKTLKRHRLTTLILAIVALGLSYISPSDLIFTIVSYVWAGIGCTFSVVVLFSLFWKRFHGRAAIITIISGMVFTVIWISGGFEQHYRVTEARTEILASQSVITGTEMEKLKALEGERFVRRSEFEAALLENIEAHDSEKDLAVITSAFIEKGVPARLTTFIFSLVVAVFSTLLVVPKGEGPADGKNF
jgi:sodium/proline symporter